ncbi:MAG: hypothetical protein IPF68_19655 [Bacteroidales bacterium]|nr:hypothetical protein [Bacteroidales bacterium]
MKNFSRNACLVAMMALISASAANAQTSTFSLSDYKNPSYLYQTLDLNFGLDNGLAIRKNSTGIDRTNNNFSFGFNAGGDYLRNSNSEKKQGDLRISLNSGISSSSSGYKYKPLTDDSKTKNFRYSERLSIDMSERFYNKKKQFFGIDAVLNSSLSGEHQNNTTTADTFNYSTKLNQTDFRSHAAISFFVGMGRIEQVQDAWLAVYLLEDLQKLNKSKRIATNEEVIELARLITSLKYKRFFDNRLRKIAEITAIDSFMQKKNIAATPDATYFTSLNDNWNFANNPVRSNGYRLFTGIEADLLYNNVKYKHETLKPENINRETTNNETIPGLFFIAGINHEKPLTLKWQQSANVKGGFGMRQDKFTKDEFETAIIDTVTKSYMETVPSINFSANYGYGYYPNSRTWLELDWSLDAGWDKRMAGTTRQDKENQQNDLYVFTGPRLRAYYYLSERIRLTLFLNGEFQFENTQYTAEDITDENSKEKTSGWNHSLQASLTYSLF